MAGRRFRVGELGGILACGTTFPLAMRELCAELSGTDLTQAALLHAMATGEVA